MGNLLELEAKNLKQKYGPSYHKTIDANFELVSRQMAAMPGSVAAEEGIIALSEGLPRTARTTRRKTGRRTQRKKYSSKRF